MAKRVAFRVRRRTCCFDTAPHFQGGSAVPLLHVRSIVRLAFVIRHRPVSRLVPLLYTDVRSGVQRQFAERVPRCDRRAVRTGCDYRVR